MGLFTGRPPPKLPSPMQEYSRGYFDELVRVLFLYFQRIDAVQQINIARLNINVDTLPTQADIADLREGDVYRDTSAGNVLKVKV